MRSLPTTGPSELIETLRLVSFIEAPNVLGFSALPTPLEVLPPLMGVLPAMTKGPRQKHRTKRAFTR